MNAQSGSGGIAVLIYRGAGKFLARPTSQCILFDGENISFHASLVIQDVPGGMCQTSGGSYQHPCISFDASLVIYVNSTNIPPFMIINRIYETQNLLSL